MYTIGEFSMLSSISKKTLRYYDEIGLLNPAELNSENGYRLYSKEQLKRSNTILHYKMLGFSLKEIKTVLEHNMNNMVLEILENKLNDIEMNIEELRSQKELVIKELNVNPEKEVKWKDYVIQEDVFPVKSIYEVYSEDDSYDVHKLIELLYHSAAEHNIKLISNHYVRKCLNVTSENLISVFAVVDNSEINENIKMQNQVKMVIITDVPIKEKTEAYASMIDYIKNIGCNPNSFIEEYKMVGGNLTVTIYGNIERSNN